jgi:hypothetical protein
VLTLQSRTRRPQGFHRVLVSIGSAFVRLGPTEQRPINMGPPSAALHKSSPVNRRVAGSNPA